MSVDEFTEYEDKSMLSNVLATCDDLAHRMQDLPGQKEKGCYDLTAGYTSELFDKQFFNDTPYLKEYINASSSKQKLPGHAYYSKLPVLKHIL